MASIAIENLSKRYRKFTAVDSLSFEVQPGSVTGFVGPNGAGKTTTMRCLLGLVQATSGAATIDGLAYADLDHPIRSVGVVLEGSAFYPGRTGRDHLRVLARTESIGNDRVDELLDYVGLSEFGNKRVKTYSMGMKQRLSVASALLGEPEVLVLDEPANGLDPGGIRWLRDVLRYHASKGGTVLISSHVLSEVALVADEIVIIDRGKLVKTSSVQELTAGAKPNVRVCAREVKRLAHALRDTGAEVQEEGADCLSVSLTAEEVGELAAANGIALRELVQERASLEDVFFDMTGTKPEASS